MSFPLPPQSVRTVARHQHQLLPGRDPLDDFERKRAHAQQRYEYAHNSSGAFTGLGKGAAAVGLFSPPALALAATFDGLAAAERATMRTTFASGFDPQSLVRARVRLKAGQLPSNEDELAAAMDAERKTFFRKEFVDDFPKLAGEQQGLFLHGAARLIIESLDYSDQKFSVLEQEVGALKIGIEDVQNQITVLTEMQKALAPLLEKAGELGALAEKQLVDSSERLAARRARLVDPGVQLQMAQQYDSLSGEDQLAWLESGLLGLAPDEAEKRGIAAQKKDRVEKAQEFAEKSQQALHGVAAGVEVLARMKILPEKFAQRIGKAAQIYSAASNLAVAFIAQNPFMAMQALGGLFGGGGDSAAASRHAEIMAALKRIEERLVRMEEKLDQIQWEQRLNHAEMLTAFYVHGLYSKGTYMMIRESELKTARLLKEEAKDVSTAKTTEDLDAELHSLADHKPLTLMAGDVSPTADSLGGFPLVRWHSVHDSGKPGIDLTDPPEVLRSWQQGVLLLHQITFEKSGGALFTALDPHVVRPDHWFRPGEHFEQSFQRVRINFLASGHFLHSLLIHEYLSSFEVLLEHQPFLSFPGLLKSPPEHIKEANLLERYRDTQDILFGMQRLLEHAMAQEALVSGTHVAPQLARLVLRCEDSADRKLTDSELEQQRVLLGLLERGHPQDSTEQFLQTHRAHLLTEVFKKAPLPWQQFAQFVRGEVFPTAPTPGVDNPRAEEPLLAPVGVNVGRWLAHLLVEGTDGNGLGMVAYSKASRATESLVVGNGMELLMRTFPQWHRLRLPLPIPEAYKPLLQSHSLNVVPVESEGGWSWRVERVIRFTRFAHSKGELSEVRRCVFELPRPDELLEHDASGIPEIKIRPTVTPAWRSLALLRNRVVSLRADVTLAHNEPDVAQMLASLLRNPLAALPNN